MRRIVALLTAAVLLSLTACAGPFQDEPESPSSAEPSFVITTQGHLGVEMMMDKVNWYDNTVCAVESIGTRANYSQKLESLRQKRFEQIDADMVREMQVIDASGNDAFLFVPRFDLVNFQVFSVALDSEGEAHILRQTGESARAFVLLCDAGSAPNVQVNAILKLETSGKEQTFKSVIRRASSGEVQYEAGFQPMEFR